MGPLGNALTNNPILAVIVCLTTAVAVSLPILAPAIDKMVRKMRLRRAWRNFDLPLIHDASDAIDVQSIRDQVDDLISDGDFFIRFNFHPKCEN